MIENKENLIMNCDPDTGICEIPSAEQGSAEDVVIAATEKPVRMLYFTDPICSSCWGVEPQLRKLKLEYGHFFDVEYRMGGLLQSWNSYGGRDVSGPESVAKHWEEAGEYYQMPIDGDVWIEDPLDSSFPPSIAFKAAQLQGEDKALVYLRRIKEMVFLEKGNISKWKNLKLAAEQVGLDVEKFQNDYQTKGQSLFEDDLKLKSELGVRGFPTVFFSDKDGNRFLVYGSQSYERYEDALKRLYPEATKTAYDTSPDALFAVYPTYTTREFAELSNISLSEAEALLNQLAEKQVITRRDSKNGPLWVRN